MVKVSGDEMSIQIVNTTWTAKAAKNIVAMLNSKVKTFQLFI